MSYPSERLTAEQAAEFPNPHTAPAVEINIIETLTHLHREAIQLGLDPGASPNEINRAKLSVPDVGYQGLESFMMKKR